MWESTAEQIAYFSEEDYEKLKPLILEQNIRTLQSHIESGVLTYEKLTQWYLYRIVKFGNDKETSLHNMIALNPDAVNEARKRDWKVKRPYSGFEGARWKNASPAHDTLLVNLKTDPFEADNLFEENKELARVLFAEMEVKYEGLGELPPSIVLRTPADESHYEYLDRKRRD